MTSPDSADDSATATLIQSPPLAPLWARLGALVLDGAVWMPVVLVLVYAGSRSAAWGPTLFASGLIGFVIYQVSMHAIFGATLGKMAFRLRVVRAADLSPIDLTDALKRHFVDAVLRFGMAFVAARTLRDSGGAVPIHDMMGFLKSLQASGSYAGLGNIDSYWTLAEVFTLSFHPRRRALHDLIAGTVVVRRTRNS